MARLSGGRLLPAMVTLGLATSGLINAQDADRVQSRPVSASPMPSWSLHVLPGSDAERAASALSKSDPRSAARLRKMAARPTATWLGNGMSSAALGSHVRKVMTSAARAAAAPVFVLYAIPHRDCGSHSAGGFPTAAGYRTFVGDVSAAVAGRRAIVVVEPDALAAMGCLTSAQQAERLALLRDVVTRLATGRTLVYLDAGNSQWLDAPAMASRLLAAGVAGARGFSLNVANFNTTANEVVYGRKVSQVIGGKSFVVDTSRNGRGPASGAMSWCNPAGRALGTSPTTRSGQPDVDAFLWVKTPGRSDGSCRAGEPRAGVFWTKYATGLAQRAGW